MISVSFRREDFSRSFSDILARVRNPVALLKVAGRELANQLIKHFRAKDRTSANKLSPRRSHFWLGVARTVGSPVMAGSKAVNVTIAHPAIAQKVFGGTITPKVAGALTIPVEERAYGRTAGTFEQETGLKLFLLKTSGFAGHLWENAVLAVKENGGIKVEYVLTKSVTQQPDPTALPPQSQLEAAILQRAQSYAANEYKLK